MKTKEELCALKEEVETLNKKLAELSTEELEQVSGGWLDQGDIPKGNVEDVFDKIKKVFEKAEKKIT